MLKLIDVPSIFRQITVTLAVLSLLSAWSLQRTSAKDFRIYTSVADESKPNAKPVVVARSLTMFRAGKVYDYMDQLGELVVFEPSLQRFIVLNGSLGMQTEVGFPLINQHLSVSEQKAKELLSLKPGQPDALNASDAAFLNFQLNPQFQITGRASDSVLTMSSPHLTYQVKVSTDVEKETLTSYFHYVDWTAKLNRILHPQAMFPQPRLVVNQELKTRGCMPKSVTLRMSLPEPRQLKADHQIQWELDESDRTWINDWEKLLKDPEIKAVPLVEYQKLFLADQVSASR